MDMPEIRRRNIAHGGICALAAIIKTGLILSSTVAEELPFANAGNALNCFWLIWGISPRRFIRLKESTTTLDICLEIANGQREQSNHRISAGIYVLCTKMKRCAYLKQQGDQVSRSTRLASVLTGDGQNQGCSRGNYEFVHAMREHALHLPASHVPRLIVAHHPLPGLSPCANARASRGATRGDAV